MSQTPLPAAIPALVKGHASGADFLLHLDRDGSNELDAAQIARLTDRHTGFGSSGLLRAVPTALADPATASRAEWFMDSRGPDGAPLEFDGNDIRLFVAYLQYSGILDLADGGSTEVATRCGVRTVRREGADYAVDMGTWQYPGGEDALADGFDVSVIAPGLTEQRPGLRVRFGGEHVVVALQDEDTLIQLGMTEQPQVDPVSAVPAMFDFVVPLGERENLDSAGTARVGVIRMRGRSTREEVRSSGTGACAAAVAVREWFGDGAPQDWHVQTPGGRLRVHTGVERVECAGPVELIGSLTVLP